MTDKTEVKVSADSTGLIFIAVILAVFLFDGDPDLADGLRVLVCKMAGLTP